MILYVALLGALLGAAIFGLITAFSRPVPDLSDAASRLQPGTNGEVTGTAPQETTMWHKAGAWLQSSPLAPYVREPSHDLAILGIAPQKWLGEKLIFAGAGFVLPWLLAMVLAAAGISIPIYIVFAAAIGFAILLFFIPDIDTRKNAALARDEFNRALCAYIDLVALERRAGVGATQALEEAAAVGDGPVFQRLREGLTRARFHGNPPWIALEGLSEELGLPDLDDIGGIIRTTDSGAGVYDALRARSKGLRGSILSKDLASANQASQRLAMPTAALSMVFLGLLITPAVLSMFG